MIPERRSCVRHKVHGPVFASFDGVTGGMILDLSEQGVSMQTIVPLEAERRVQLRLDLPDSDGQLETTGYIAWADALGRAGVRFSDLPEQARQRLDEWLMLNEKAPSRKAPKLTFERMLGMGIGTRSSGKAESKPRSVSLEGIGLEEGSVEGAAGSSTIQYEFNELGPDLNSGLRVISERARTLLRGDGAAIALMDRGPMMCRASVGKGGPPLGTHVDVEAGFSGECIRTGRALRCDDSEMDPRVEAETCRRLGIRSIVAAPIRYEREVVGLLEVFSAQTFAFDEGDVAVLERLAQTALLMLSQVERFYRRRKKES
ncbi:MAG TPA: GAF domain-containing protein [Candidatus Sulfotelmatobacter sp.]|nr:GAF domain-containing protein [Candidatus Sulfotelmatobacter sp.]